jgi:cytoskeletal protein RodZ
MNSETISSAEPAPQSSVSGPGATLRAAREALRLELTQVAAETRIPLRHLAAIEEDNFESLPSRAYAIGFSRTFAKAVGLDDAAITDAVRAELAGGTMRRSVPSREMEPGDPARLPSAGLAWTAAGVVLLLFVGIVAWFSTSFGAGTEPGSLIEPAPAATATTAATGPSPAPTTAVSGPVVLTALDENVWLRLYEEGGERLVERTLAKGEAVTVPATAADPRINTGRPDALAVTVGGQPVAPLGTRAVRISGVPVSAAALLARAEPAPQAAASPAAAGTIPQARRAAPRRTSQPGPGAGIEAAAAAAPAAEAAADPAAPSESAPVTRG